METAIGSLRTQVLPLDHVLDTLVAGCFPNDQIFPDAADVAFVLCYGLVTYCSRSVILVRKRHHPQPEIEYAVAARTALDRAMGLHEGFNSALRSLLNFSYGPNGDGTPTLRMVNEIRGYQATGNRYLMSPSDCTRSLIAMSPVYHALSESRLAAWVTVDPMLVFQIGALCRHASPAIVQICAEHA